MSSFYNNRKRAVSNEEYINVINIIYRYNRLRKTMNIKKKNTKYIYLS